MKFECTNYKKVGSMRIKSGKIDITDPGYDQDVWCRMNGIEVKPGTYDCLVSVLKGHTAKQAGKRVVSMIIVHRDAVDSGRLDLEYIGEVGVDAGLMSISESGVKPDYGEEAWLDCCKLLEKKSNEPKTRFWNGVEAYVTDEFGSTGKKAKQFWASSGFGDGVYGVFGIDSHHPKSIEFIPDVVMVEFIVPDDIES